MAKKPVEGAGALPARTKSVPAQPGKGRSKQSIAFDPEGAVKSAKGTATFAYLSKPDVFQGGEPHHKITVTFDKDDPEFTAMCERMLAFENEFLRANNKAAVTTPTAVKADKKSGLPCITFRTKAKANADAPHGYTPVPVVGADAKPTSVEVWGGDTVRVVFILGGWTSAFGAGTKPYLNAVQIVRKAQRVASTKSTALFSDESDGEAAPEVDVLPDEAVAEGGDLLGDE